MTKGMSKYLIDQIGETPNVRVRTRSWVVAARGENNLEELTIAGAAGTEERVPATSLFIFIGAEPRTAWLDGVVERDPKGFIPTGPELLRDGQRPPGWPLDRDPYLLETSVPGIFAAGDVRLGSVKRVASGVGEGAIAVSFIHQYLAKV